MDACESRSNTQPNYKELVDGKFTETRIMILKKAFKKIMIKDKKKPKGSDEPDRMNTSDIGTLLRMVNFNPLKSEIETMMHAIDPQKEGTITFYQFLYLVWMRTISGEEQDILSAFQLLDTDNDGIISLKELQRLLIKVGEPFDEKEVESFCLHADINEDGNIPYEDFVNRMNVEEESDTRKNSKFVARDSEEHDEENENLEETEE